MPHTDRNGERCARAARVPAHAPFADRWM